MQSQNHRKLFRDDNDSNGRQQTMNCRIREELSKDSETKNPKQNLENAGRHPNTQG